MGSDVSRERKISFGAGLLLAVAGGYYLNSRAKKIVKQRFLFCGSGAGAFSNDKIVRSVVDLCGKKKPKVLYVGTATYDSESSREAQTSCFLRFGCSISDLELADRTPGRKEIMELFEKADIVLISGGNSLWMIDRWNALGIDKHLKSAIERGVVMCGGSAGAIAWFDSGHSDSMDPTTYKKPKPSEDSWKYIRVPALGVFPGLCCPHHDKTQSNGMPRAADLDEMLLRHSGETGVCIDHHAGLRIIGEEYEVLTWGENPSGTLVYDGDAPKCVPYEKDRRGKGQPAVWTKTVVNGKVIPKLVPRKGKNSDIFIPASKTVVDPLCDVAGKQNLQPEY